MSLSYIGCLIGGDIEYYECTTCGTLYPVMERSVPCKCDKCGTLHHTTIKEIKYNENPENGVVITECPFCEPKEEKENEKIAMFEDNPLAKVVYNITIGSMLRELRGTRRYRAARAERRERTNRIKRRSRRNRTNRTSRARWNGWESSIS